MAIVINGSGTVTGLAVGGLPDDSVDEGSLANSINSEITANTAKTGITSSQATAITAALPKAGGTVTGNVIHNDNVKALFGTGSDLQIYHDGSNSYVKDDGNGDLYLMGGAEVLIRSYDNENMIKAVRNGAVSLYHNNAAKLATTATGVTVTGAIGGATNLGKVLQVVSVANGSQQATTSATWVAHSGLVAAITPSASSSKILVSIAFSYRTANGTNNFNATVYRGSTNLLHSTKGSGTLFSGSSYYQGHQTIQFLDSPSTTNATTYQLYYQGTSNTVINNDSGIGTITLMEIGA